MTNKECVARLRDKSSWLCCKDEGAFEEALKRGADALEAMPDSVTIAELIEGHSMLQTTLFCAMLQLVSLQGLAGRNPPLKKLDAIAARQMMGLYRSINHEKFHERYNAALLGLVGGDGKP